MTAWNVLHEPWIPVVATGGERRELGLLDALAQAHELADITDASPLVRFGIHRLLAAFLLDALQPETLDDLGDRLEAGRFDRAELERYADSCGPCFDLFDADRPFLQSSAAITAGESPSPIAVLAQHLPTGSEATHFHHGPASDVAFSPAACARLLTTLAPFMTEGGSGKSPSVNGAPPWYVQITGRSLAETLLLNLCLLPRPQVPLRGVPAWRSADSVAVKETRPPTSELECLTWRPRLVRLLPSGESGTCSYLGQRPGVLVRETVFSAGFKAENPKGLWRDPAAAYRIADDAIRPVRPRESDVLWRDVGPFTVLTEVDRPAGEERWYDRPRVVSQFVELQHRGILERGRGLQIECCGIRTKQAKIFEWDADRLAIPSACLENPIAGWQMQAAIEIVGDAHWAIRSAVKDVYPRGGAGNKSAFGRRCELAGRVLWSTIRPDFDTWFLHELAEQDQGDPEAPETLRIAWAERVVRSGWHALSLAIDDLDADAESIKRQVAARDRFAKFTRKFTPKAGAAT